MFTRILGIIGKKTILCIGTTLAICVLVFETFNWLFVQPLLGRGLRWKDAIENFLEFGYRSLPIVGLISLLVGIIMGMQSAYTLQQWGATIFIANLVGISALRELAPLMSAILITGRSGSAITAEIGTMKISEEIDALIVMGLSPFKYLVVPKFIGMLFAVPCVTVISMAIMIAGGFIVGVGILGLDFWAYFDQTAKALTSKDLFSGMVKSVFFGLTICWVGIYKGFQVEGSAESVGRMTTSSVVTSIFTIIIVDLIWTSLFYFS
ncbi:MAG: ABC transporter permease [Candidatus Hydrogenedentes bacterium]|nr:ABC transporter permease [Candidatus Hydrogenedentota bacterium]